MKGKNVFFALGLSLVMGLGAVAALGANRSIKEAKADSTRTFYVLRNWGGDWDGAPYLYYTGGSHGISWNDSVEMTQVEASYTHASKTGPLYSYDVPTDVTLMVLRNHGKNKQLADYNVTSWGSYANNAAYMEWTEEDGDHLVGFTYNPSAITYTVHVYADGVDKGNQTVDEGELPDAPGIYGKNFVGWYDNAEMTAGHEVLAINSNTTVYGKYEAVPTVRYYLNLSRGEIGTFDAQYLYAYESGERKNAAWPGEAIDSFPKQFTVPNDAKLVINAGQDKEQTVDITQTGIADDTLYILSSKTDGKYDVLWESQRDEPEENGTYYLVGTETNWKYKNAPAMDTESKYLENNTAILFDYEAKAGEEVKARGVFGGQEKWYGITGLDGDNLVFADAGHYDIYLNSALELSAAPAVARHDATIVCYKFAGSVLEGTEVQTNIIYESVAFNPSVSVSGYILRGIYTEYPFQHLYEPDIETSNVYLYAKFTKACYYLVGDDAFMGEGHGWNVDYASAVSAGEGQNRLVGTVVIPEGADAEHPVAVKPLRYGLQTDGHEDPSGTPGFIAEYYTMGEERAFVSLDGSGNFAFTEPGTYAFYVNNENAVYFNMGEYAFHAKFLTEVGGMCSGIEAGTKTVEQLKAIWADQKAAYNSLSAADKKNITDVGFDGGDELSADDRLKMVAKYNRIITKYGLSNFEDFIWHQESLSNRIGTTANNSNTALLVVVISVTAVIAGCGVAFYFLRKKHVK